MSNPLPEHLVPVLDPPQFLVEKYGEAKSRIKALEKENQDLRDALASWQAVVRVARIKDSTLPDPEAS